MSDLRRQRSAILMAATIAPRETAAISTRAQAAFRPERLSVSSNSFPLPLGRRVWTRFLVTLGGVLARGHRRLAKLLHVDLYAPRERREYVTIEYARLHAEEVYWDEDSEDDEQPFILVQVPRSRRACVLALVDRAQRWLLECRLRWQQEQLSTLRIEDITISGQSQFAEGASMPATDLFVAPNATFVNCDSCSAGQEIKITVHNHNRRECRLIMSLIGTMHVSGS